MAKLTGITNEETTLADDDLLYTVDVSDTTDDPAGSSAKIQVQNLLKAGHFNSEASLDGQVLTSDGAGNAAWETPAAGGGGGGPAQTIQVETVIESVTLNGSTSHTFSNIPQTFKYLKLRGRVRDNTAAGTYTELVGYWNGDQNANYYSQVGAATNTTFLGGEGYNQTAHSIAIIDPALTPEMFTPVDLDLFNYSESGIRKRGIAMFANYRTVDSQQYAGFYAFGNDVLTDPITSFTIRSDNGTELLYGEFELVGIGEVTVPSPFTGPAEQTIEGIELLDTQTVTGGSAISFTLPDLSGYDAVWFEGEVSSSIVSDADALEMEINGDTTPTNYHSQRNYGDNGAASVSESSTAEVAIIAGSTSSDVGWARIDLINYTANGQAIGGLGTFLLGRASARINAGNIGMSNRIETGAATTIDFKVPAETLTGTMKLYGRKALTIPAPYEGALSQSIEGKILIGEITNTTAGTFDFTIPAGYKNLIIQGELRSTDAAVGDVAFMYINGDTTVTNYMCQITKTFDGANNAPAELREPVFAELPANGGIANAYTPIYVNLPNPDGTTNRKAWISTSQNYYIQDVSHSLVLTGTTWNSTAAISSLQIAGELSGLVGTLRVFGEKQITVPSTYTGPAEQTVTTLVEVGRITNASGGDFDFTSIPQDGEALVLKGHFTGSIAGADGVNIYFNGDLTDANYHHQGNYGYNNTGQNNESSIPRIALASGTSPADNQGAVEIRIPNYTGSKIKSAFSQGNAINSTNQQQYCAMHSVVHDTMTAPVTSVYIRADGHPTDSLTGEVVLYVEKSVSIPAPTASQLKELPVVQVSSWDHPNTLDWASEPGWSINNEAAGQYRVTFPTAAPSAAEQVVMATPDRESGNTSYTAVVSEITATTCLVTVYNTSNVATDYKFSVARFLPKEQAVVYGIAGMAGEVRKIELDRISFAEGAGGKFDFTNIPSGYDRLILQGKIRSDVIADGDILRVYFNNDTTETNYFYQRQLVQGASQSIDEGAYPRFLDCVADGVNAFGYSSVYAEIEAPGVGYSKSMTVEGDRYYSVGARNDIQRLNIVHDTMTAAITQLTIQTDNDPTDQLEGYLVLYGEKTL